MSKLGALASKLSTARIALTLLLLPIACMTSHAPHVAPNGTLGLSNRNGVEPKDAGPFRVMYASPIGELHGPSEITVLFSKPMRPLGLAGAETPFPAKIDPPVIGTWQWVGTRAASFVPARPNGEPGGSYRLPGATKYSVTIPRGTAALDGELLKDDYTFAFSTEHPAIVSTDPWNEADDLEPDASWAIRFNQPITDAEIARAAHLVGGASEIGFDVKRDAADDLKEARIVPKAHLPLDTNFKLTFDASMTSADGPIPMGEPAIYSFSTYGPLRVETISCNDTFSPHGKCDPSSGIAVSFTNAVKMKDVKKAITADGVKLAWPSYYPDDEDVKSVSLGGAFRAAGTYTIRVSQPLKDSHGQALESPATQTLHFDDHWPLARIGMNDGLLEAKSTRRDPIVASVNADDLEIAAAKLGEDDILAIEDASGPVSFGVVSGLPGAKVKNAQKGATNAVVRERVALADVLGGAQANGAFAIGIRYTGPRGKNKVENHSIGQVTDLAITAKISRPGTLVRVTHLSDASAVAGANVKIRRPGEPGVSVKTDTQGFATFSASDFKPVFRDDKAVIFASTDADSCFKAVNDNIESSEFSSEEDGEIGLVFTDRGI